MDEQHFKKKKEKKKTVETAGKAVGAGAELRLGSA